MEITHRHIDESIKEIYSNFWYKNLSKWAFANDCIYLISVHPPLPLGNNVVMILIIKSIIDE